MTLAPRADPGERPGHDPFRHGEGGWPMILTPEERDTDTPKPSHPEMPGVSGFGPAVAFRSARVPATFDGESAPPENTVTLGWIVV
jgi:hypothetical protein